MFIKLYLRLEDYIKSIFDLHKETKAIEQRIINKATKKYEEEKLQTTKEGKNDMKNNNK